MDRDCDVGACVLPLPAGYVAVRDLTCTADGCVAAVGGTLPGTGALLAYKPDLGSGVPRAIVEDVDPIGAAILPGSTGVLFTTTAATVRRASFSEGIQDGYFLLPDVATGDIVVSPYGNFGISTLAISELISLKNLNATGPVDCLAGGDHCNVIELWGLSNGEDSIERTSLPVAVLLRHTGEFRVATSYVAFQNKARISVTSFDPTDFRLISPSSGFFSALSQIAPRTLTLSPGGSHLYVAGGTSGQTAEAAIVPAGGLPADHVPTPFDLPPGVCPSALLADDDHLWLADDCQATIWALPLGAGGIPDAAAAVPHRIPACTSAFRLASPGPGTLLVACRGQDRIFVLGRD